MKLLFTAFKGIHNTSFQLVNQTGADYVLLTNSFRGLEKDIATVSGEYDSVYMFGVDKRLKDKIRIELCARDQNETVKTELDLSHLEEVLRAEDIPYTISNQPTRYLCNAAYYHMLRKNPNTVLIHIPSICGMTRELMEKLIAIFREIRLV